jgi:hypothetical protein
MEADQNIRVLQAGESNWTAKKQIQRNQSGCIVKASPARSFSTRKDWPEIFNKKALAPALF